MDLISLMAQNILSPAALFFGLGLIAGTLKSDLEVPDSISRYFSIYLMMSIGFKGGVTIANTPEYTLAMLCILLAGVLMSFAQPFISYGLLKLTTRLDSPTCAATAAQYGSVSIVTFVTAVAFLKMEQVSYGGYVVAVLALMEAPAILSGLFIAHRTAPETRNHAMEEKKLSREIFTNGAILLLMGAFVIGWITGQPGMEKVEGFFVTPFQGVLCFFLLDMGLVVAQNLSHLRQFNLPLIAFGIYMPMLGSLIGLSIARWVGVDIGTGTLFAVLCGSASYIAVPAAMRLALPEAQTAIYVPMSLAITFPFNVIVGIPLYYTLANMWLK